jgi:hypothetical protein
MLKMTTIATRRKYMIGDTTSETVIDGRVLQHTSNTNLADTGSSNIFTVYTCGQPTVPHRVSQAEPSKSSYK